VILVQVAQGDVGAASGDVVALGLTGTAAAPRLLASAQPAAVSTAAANFVAQFQPDPAAGQVHRLPLPGQRPSTVLLLGLGDESPDAFRVAGVALGRAVAEVADDQRVVSAIDAATPAKSRALAEGLVLGGYDFTLASKATDRLRVVELAGRVDAVAVRAGDDAADAAGWARDLGNTPANVLTPLNLGEVASAQLSAAGCTVTVHVTDWLTANGFGGVLAVGGGADNAPCLIEATYRPSAPNKLPGKKKPPTIVLVGKGITFDSGGLNLKPPAAMRMMHTDMTGGAAVLGAIQYCAMQELPVNVIALVPAAENAVSGRSMRPSDVITQYGGRTTEIGNTDAEGRLVLADALAYAVKRYAPDAVIDLATLTGAMKVALGLGMGGYFANDDALAAQLDRAAVNSGEQLWRLPLEHAYQSMLDSAIADSRNDPGNPGAITAALFLQPFVGKTAWAHLDIAGPARATEAGEVVSRGATGYGVRLLASYLDLVAAAAGH